MELRDSDRMRTRLYALDMRLAELDSERLRAQVRVHHLEAALEDARLAKIMGDEAGDPAELGPELERSRTQLETRCEEANRVRKLQQRVRVQCITQRLRERREERAQQTRSPNPERPHSEPPHSGGSHLGPAESE